MAKRKRRSFTAEFKAEVVALVKVGDRSIRQVAKDLDLGETVLRSWVLRAEADAGKKPQEALTTAEREELATLRRENKRLLMEREILKTVWGGALPVGPEARVLRRGRARKERPAAFW